MSVPTHVNLVRSESNGAVTVDAAYSHLFVNAAPIGLIVQLTGTSRWIWISDTTPHKARLAHSEEHAKKALLAHTLKHQGIR